MREITDDVAIARRGGQVLLWANDGGDPVELSPHDPALIALELLPPEELLEKAPGFFEGHYFDEYPFRQMKTGTVRIQPGITFCFGRNHDVQVLAVAPQQVELHARGDLVELSEDEALRLGYLMARLAAMRAEQEKES